MCSSTELDPTRSTAPERNGSAVASATTSIGCAGSTSRRMSSARPSASASSRRALVSERGPRPELEVDRAGVHGLLVGGGPRRVPLRAGAGQQRVDAVEQVRPPGGEVLVQRGHQRVGLCWCLGPDGLLDEVEEALDALGVGPPGHGIDAGPPAHPRDHASVPPVDPPSARREAVDRPVERDHVEAPRGVLAERRDARDRRHRAASGSGRAGRRAAWPRAGGSLQ